MVRYINADKLYEEMLNSTAINTLEVIKKQPIADVAPVVHAHWVNYCDYGSDYELFTNGYTCSNCNHIWWETICQTPYHFRYVHMPRGSYCPNCGAKMDEVAEDGEIEKAKVENDG